MGTVSLRVKRVVTKHPAPCNCYRMPVVLGVYIKTQSDVLAWGEQTLLLSCHPCLDCSCWKVTSVFLQNLFTELWLLPCFATSFSPTALDPNTYLPPPSFYLSTYFLFLFCLVLISWDPLAWCLLHDSSKLVRRLGDKIHFQYCFMTEMGAMSLSWDS